MADVTMFDKFRQLAQRMVPQRTVHAGDEKPQMSPEQETELALSGWLSSAPPEFWQMLSSEARLARSQAEVHIATHAVAARWLGYESALHDLHARFLTWSGQGR